MTTIHDVAKLAGVSIGTVSNVINQNKKVAPDTAARVTEAIQNLHYVPNTIAKSLKTKQTHILGILAEDISACFSGDIIDGICKYSEDHDYTVKLCNLRVNHKVKHEKAFLYEELEQSVTFRKSVEKSINLLQASQVDGIIYIGVHPRDVGNILPVLNVPVVYVYSYTTQDNYCVNYDDFQGAELAVEYLIKMGHQKIALLCGSINSIPAHKRLMGYQETLMKHRLPFRPEYICAGNWHYEDGYQNSLRLLNLPEPPTAIFSMSDLMAYGAINAALDLKKNIPNDISIHGFDGLEHSAHTHPALSTINPPLREMGVKSAETLLSIINHMPPDVHNILLPCSHIIRGTVRDNSQAAP